MATAPHLVSVNEYLNTSYSPDCEYVDGMILERNVGKGKHSFAQARFILILSHQLAGRAVVLPEQRTRVSPERVRIPDVSVVAQLQEITTDPPLLCVEIVSPDDQWKRVLAAVSDYQEMGVQCVWVVDPYAVRAWIFELNRPPLEVADGKLTASTLESEVALAEVLP